MIAAKHKISTQSNLVLDDPISIHNYVTPNIIETYSLNRCNLSKSWLVQLANWMMRKVSEVVKIFPLEINGLFTWENINIFSLSYYDVLIGIEWLESHWVSNDF